ncbi:MAG: hypothetical protein GXO77_02235, partial [Calditrichaeota bacterium]|nr:hypothetical protein [Calditrichota bacterium]
MKFVKKFAFLILFVLLITLVLSNELFCKSQSTSETMPPVELFTNATALTEGNWVYWQTNNWVSGYNPFTRQAGGIFPKNTASTIYGDGFLWGCWFPDDDNPVRVGGVTYRSAMIPGPYGSDPAAQKIYRIRPDWKSLVSEDLLIDAEVLFNLSPEQVTQAHIRQILDDYAYNWKNWPVEQGAPYVDVNDNGRYDPVPDEDGYPDPNLGDYPGIRHAAMVIWYVMNDADSNKTRHAFKSIPIGIEDQVTVWMYKTDFLSDVIFQRHKLINYSDRDIDSLYVGKWADFDIGDYGDDLVGCDSLLNLGYTYNDKDDAGFSKFNLAPPAVGVMFAPDPDLHLPALPMNSFVYFEAGNLVEPCVEWNYCKFNSLRGFGYTDDIRNPSPYFHFTGPNKDKATKFPFNGDPVTKNGDVDGIENYPGDRRMQINSGPFKLARNESKTITVAIIGGLGDDYLQSVVDLKEKAQKIFDGNIRPVSASLVKKEVNASNARSKIRLSFTVPNDPKVSACKLNFRRANSDDFLFSSVPTITENDSFPNSTLWEAEIDIENQKYPLDVDLLIQTSDGEWHTVSDFITSLTARPAPVIKNFRVIWENGKQDKKVNFNEKVHLALEIQNVDQANGISAITALSQNTKTVSNVFIPAGASYGGDSLFIVFTAPRSGDLFKIDFKLIFDENYASYQLQAPLEPWQPTAFWKDTLKIEHLSGYGFTCYPVVADPAVVTRHQYIIWFSVNPPDSQLYWSLKDITANEIKLADQPLGYRSDADFPIVDGIEWKIYNTESGLAGIVEVANRNGPLPPEEWDKEGTALGGNNVWHSLSAPSDANAFYISAGGGDGSLERIMSSIQNARRHDFELRFTDRDTGVYAWWYDADTFAYVPFEAWDVGIGTYDDPSDDIRLLTG